MSTAASPALQRPDPAQVWDWLSELTDPEIPVVTLREMGILRQVQVQDDHIAVTITPTYSGCPAMSQIEDDVRAALAAQGIDADVVSQLSPAWTTDWMTEHAKRKLRAYGIAPPHALPASATDAGAASVVRWMTQPPSAPMACPHCGSSNTTETSAFGSTACKSLHKCLDCLEPFDYFKPH